MLKMSMSVDFKPITAFLDKADKAYKKDNRKIVSDILFRWAHHVFPQRILLNQVRGPGLKQSTLEIRKRVYGLGATPKLFRTGELALSQKVLKVQEDYGEVGSSFEWNIIHELGGTTESDSAIKGKRVPARPWTYVDSRDFDNDFQKLVTFHFQPWGGK